MPTEITCVVPVQISVAAATEAELDQRFNFRTRDFLVAVAFRFSNRMTLPESTAGFQGSGGVSGIVLTLTPQSGSAWTEQRLRDSWATAEGQQEIVESVLRVANHFLRTLRVQGNVLGLEEFRFRSLKPASQLRRLGLKLTIGADVFEPPKGDGLANLFADFESAPGAFFLTTYAPQVREMLEDNRPIEPEDEFLINSLEFLNKRNLRMAIIESTIALEIAMSRYLPIALAKKGVSAKAIKEFLSPELGLNKRITAVLPLLDSFDKIEFLKVRSLVRNRNRIVHITGYLDPSIGHAEIEEQVGATENLIARLRHLRLNTELEPEKKTIADKLLAIPGVLGIETTLRSDHKIYFEVTVSSTEPSDPNQIIDALIASAKARDARFDKKDHLFALVRNVAGAVLAAFASNTLHVFKAAAGENAEDAR